MAYDIFISYRRKGGSDYARKLQLALMARNYNVFLDVDELAYGKFDHRILEAIDSAPIFMLVLSPHALDRCVDEDDWVRKEIEYAIQKRRHIIPVNPDLLFDDYPAGFPEELKAGFGLHNFVEIMFTGQIFIPTFERMVNKYIEPLLQQQDSASAAEAQKQTGALFHVETDMECRILKFGEEIATAHPGEKLTICLRKGRHKLEIVSTECPEDRLSKICTVEDADIEDFIEVELLPMRKKRLQVEREERRRQEEEARKAEAERKAKEEAERKRIIDMFDMAYVAGGTFTMGASSSDSEAYHDEKPAHRVTLSGYYIGKYEVTQKQWVAVMGSNPSNRKGDNLPVENVSWDDAQEFIRKLNARTGKNYRLPTEAEWEFAARGGNSSRGYKYSGSNNIDAVAWYDENSGRKTYPVGTKSPNELGIYDMTGNVREWCQDWFDTNYYSNSPSTNPTGPSSGANRVLRGGSWIDSARICRVSCRYSNMQDLRSYIIGFRLALSE